MSSNSVPKESSAAFSTTTGVVALFAGVLGDVAFEGLWEGLEGVALFEFIGTDWGCFDARVVCRGWGEI